MTTRQEEQQRAIADAMETPGVRQMVNVYGKIAPYTGIRIETMATVTANATGGNA